MAIKQNGRLQNCRRNTLLAFVLRGHPRNRSFTSGQTTTSRGAGNPKIWKTFCKAIIRKKSSDSECTSHCQLPIEGKQLEWLHCARPLLNGISFSSATSWKKKPQDFYEQLKGCSGLAFCVKSECNKLAQCNQPRRPLLLQQTILLLHCYRVAAVQCNGFHSLEEKIIKIVITGLLQFGVRN